jgi:hypothetical protein
VEKKTPLKESANAHIEEYLSFFVGLPHPPKFAILLSGQWGIGKTHLIKRILESTFLDDSARYVYVSLYGATSVEQIRWEILGQLYPALNSTAGKWGRRLFEAGLKKLPFDVDLTAADIPKLKKPDLYVFDDLERACLPLDSIFGFINSIVEQDGEKVVLIGNEAELDSNNIGEYRRKKEKLIGKTLGVNPSLDEAIDFFFSEVDDQKALSFLESEKDRIVRIFIESAAGNLRILKQTIWDFERFFKVVPSRYSEHKNFSEFFALFFALSIEYKSGSLKADDLLKRTSARMRDIRAMTRGHLGDGREKVELSPFKSLDGKYSAVEIYREWPTDSFMFEVLVNGRVLPSAVAKEMSFSPYFGDTGKVPNWKVLWEFFDIPEPSIQKALDEVWDEIDKKQIIDHLHFLQVWGILLFYADMEIIGLSRKEVFEKGEAYINELFRADLLTKIDLNDPWETDITVFEGYQFREIESDEMTRLIELVKQLRKATLDRSLPKLAGWLCDLMSQDVDAFKAAVSSPAAKNSVFSVPIMAFINVDDFWDRLLELDPVDWSKVFSGLKARFESDRLSKDLSEELSWLQEFKEVGEKRIEGVKPISRAQLKQRLLLIGKLLADVDGQVNV